MRTLLSSISMLFYFGLSLQPGNTFAFICVVTAWTLLVLFAMGTDAVAFVKQNRQKLRR